jgi:hypothetical protein
MYGCIILGPIPQHLQKEYKIGKFVEADTAIAEGEGCMLGFYNNEGKISRVHAEVFSGVPVRSKNARIPVGTLVKTTEENPFVTDWSSEAKTSRKWGVEGSILVCHDSHGLCYEVRHPDGSVGYYDPTELELV